MDYNRYCNDCWRKVQRSKVLFSGGCCGPTPSFLPFFLLDGESILRHFRREKREGGLAIKCRSLFPFLRSIDRPSPAMPRPKGPASIHTRGILTLFFCTCVVHGAFLFYFLRDGHKETRASTSIAAAIILPLTRVARSFFHRCRFVLIHPRAQAVSSAYENARASSQAYASQWNQGASSSG